MLVLFALGDQPFYFAEQMGNAELVVEDEGIGRANGAPAKGTGIGSRIVNAMCVSLGTQIEYRDLQPGTAAHLIFSTRLRRSVTT